MQRVRVEGGAENKTAAALGKSYDGRASAN
jgi:hypothetical protein